MKLQSIRLSVGRTARFVSEGRAATAVDLTGYRARIDALKSVPAATDYYGLPWPRYRSQFWTYMFNGAYRSVASRTLVAALLPLRAEDDLPPVAGCRQVTLEVFWHPFAVTTVAHLELAAVDPWPSDDAAAELLYGISCEPLLVGAQVRDGVPVDRTPQIPAVDSRGSRATFEDAGRFVLISGLHGEPEPTAPASSLATVFQNPPRPEAAKPLREGNGAVCVRDDRVGLVLAGSTFRAGQRINCLHHNVATLLAYVQNLATLTPAQVNEPVRWFQGQAAGILHLLVNRTSLDTGAVYRSWVPELWIGARGLNAAIDDLMPPDLKYAIGPGPAR